MLISRRRPTDGREHEFPHGTLPCWTHTVACLQDQLVASEELLFLDTIPTLSRCEWGRDREQLPDDFDFDVLRRVMHDFYKWRKIPTVHKLAEFFKEDDSLPSESVTTIHRMQLKVGFLYKKRSRNSLLIKATHIIQWRRKYLRQIKKVRRQGRPIFYTDETCVNAGHTVSRGWVEETIKSAEHTKKANLTIGPLNPSGKEGRLIITHRGNEDGFITAAGEVFRARMSTGNYHDEIDGAHYEKRFKKKILPNLPPESAIALDNAPYHSVKLEKVPRMSTLKKDIQAWLSLKVVTWNCDKVKAEQMKLLQTVSTEVSQ
ncbi:hypothetical protein HPB51_022660 [Rhipicephalus microplus]|uniref:Uncharacterized protein n=1 Tax=Rhipicephalus microplus TaxID=6941 RepID=A0A9J6E4V2_RHIMP|nr:hypothetical protein HPB51_022660 [Rhipicephalus microplus]